jgi:hypothetical protein
MRHRGIPASIHRRKAIAQGGPVASFSHADWMSPPFTHRPAATDKSRIEPNQTPHPAEQEYSFRI